MPRPKPLVHQSTTSTGASNLALATENGKQSFAGAYSTGSVNRFDYFVAHRTAAEWEYGQGYMNDATTLVRLTPIKGSSGNGVPVNFSAGLKDVASDYPPEAIGNEHLAQMAASTIKGRITGSTGDPEDLTAAQVRTLINVADGANNYVHPNHTGDVTSVGGGATTIANDAVTTAKILDAAVTTAKIANRNVDNSKLIWMPLNTIKGTPDNLGGDPIDLTATQVRTILNVANGANAYVHPNHSGDVTSVGDGATTIALNAVTNAKLQDMVPYSIKGNYTGAVADPQDLTGTQALAILNAVNRAGDTMQGRLGLAATGLHAPELDNITTRTNSGFFWTSTASVADGWPFDGDYCHLITSTHGFEGNYFSFQLAANYWSDADIYVRCTTDLGTRPWKKIHHSGNNNPLQLSGGTMTGRIELSVHGLGLHPVADISIRRDSGFYEASVASEIAKGWPENGISFRGVFATHVNVTNNYSLQIVCSDDPTKLYFRTTIDNGLAPWYKIVTQASVGIVTNTMLAGSIAASKLVGTDINTVGTITTGTWNAGNVTANGGDALLTSVASNAAGLRLTRTANPVDQKTVDIVQYDGTVRFRFLNDAVNIESVFMQAHRNAGTYTTSYVNFPSGNVGIGVMPTDNVKLDVVGTVRGDSFWAKGVDPGIGMDAITGDCYLWFWRAAGAVNHKSIEVIQDSSGFRFRFGNDAYNAFEDCLVFTQNAGTYTTNYVQFPNGNVGIGMVPTDKLSVNGVIRGASLVVNGGGLWEPGVILTDGGSGMAFRAKQASPATDEFGWYNSVGTRLMSINAAGALVHTGPIRGASLTVSGGGSYEPGCIYGDANYGMLFRVKQANPVDAQYSWRKSDGAEVMSINPSGTLNVNGAIAASGPILHGAGGIESTDRASLTAYTPGGFWHTNSATTGEGWPVDTTWMSGLTVSGHPAHGYYGWQLAAGWFDNNLWFRSVNNNSLPWRYLIHSGNTSAITSVGTITTGTWNAGNVTANAVLASYTDAGQNQLKMLRSVNGNDARHFDIVQADTTVQFRFANDPETLASPWLTAVRNANTYTTNYVYFPNGNVGVGMVPSAKLSVAGDINLTGILSPSVSGIGSAHKDDITTSTNSGFFHTNSASPSEGWPFGSGVDGNWIQLLSSGAGGFWGFQFACSWFDQNLYFRSTANSGTTGWNLVYHGGTAAGTIPASKLVGTDITTVGNITAGTWNAGLVNVAGDVTASGNLYANSGLVRAWSAGQTTLRLFTNGSPADQKQVEFLQYSGDFCEFRFVNDAYSAASSWLLAYRNAGTYTTNYVNFPNGKVGIGTVPRTIGNCKLDVAGGIFGQKVYADGTGAELGCTALTGDPWFGLWREASPANQRSVEFTDDGAARFRFTDDNWTGLSEWLTVTRNAGTYTTNYVHFPSGNVGVGMVPTQKLSVAGNIDLTGAVVLSSQGFVPATRNDIKTHTPAGIYLTSVASEANGWPVGSSTYWDSCHGVGTTMAKTIRRS